MNKFSSHQNSKQNLKGKNITESSVSLSDNKPIQNAFNKVNDYLRSSADKEDSSSLSKSNEKGMPDSIASVYN